MVKDLIGKKDDLNWQLFVLKTIQSTDRYIPHRNKTVKHYNTVIRNKLMDHPDERLVIGDLLLSYSTIYSDENFNIVENSGSYIVKSIKPFKYEINNVEYFGQRIVVKEAEGYDGYHRELDVLDPKCYRQYLSLMQEVYEKCKKKRDYTELNNTKNKFAIMDSLYNLFKMIKMYRNISICELFLEFLHLIMLMPSRHTNRKDRLTILYL
jgi:hypothetical protein